MHVGRCDLEPQAEGQCAHEVLGGLVGVRERPCDGARPELAVLGRDVRAAAVLEVAGDGVVELAVDGRDLALGDERADLVGMRAVADEVVAAVAVLHAEFVDAFQRGEVGVDVGDDRDGVTASRSCATPASWTPSGEGCGCREDSLHELTAWLG